MKDPFIGVNFPRRKSRNIIRTKIKSGKTHRADGAVESFVHDIFLIMNIAAPGSCNFYKASLSGGQFQQDISLSNVPFELALLTFLDSGWPSLQILALEQVVPWFYAVRRGVSQVPENPMERVLFALLHISMVGMSPIVVIWLFFAFESLLHTRTGENFSSLVNRLGLLLETNESESRILKRKMRDLYDIRSAIVHGGFEVSHPLHNESLDKRVDENFVRLSNATDFGYAILVASVQKTIQNGWKFPRFKETIGGESVQ